MAALTGPALPLCAAAAALKKITEIFLPPPLRLQHRGAHLDRAGAELPSPRAAAPRAPACCQAPLLTREGHRPVLASLDFPSKRCWDAADGRGARRGWREESHAPGAGAPRGWQSPAPPARAPRGAGL